MPEQPLKILLMNGPNLNMLGKRDPTQYGNFTLRDVEQLAEQTAESLGYRLDCFQSNHEGTLIDKIHEAMGDYAGIVINAGAFTHYSYALHDALELCAMPVMEVHISDIHQREAFRRISVIEDACVGQISGLGIDSYRVGIERLVSYLKGDTHDNNT